MAFQLERHLLLSGAKIELKSIGDASEIWTVKRYDVVQSLPVEGDTEFTKPLCIPNLEASSYFLQVGLPHSKIDDMQAGKEGGRQFGNVVEGKNKSALIELRSINTLSAAWALCER